MHMPACPVKMPSTLQRRCANCHYGFEPAPSSGFGFSRSSKGSCLRFNDMPIRLPFGSLRRRCGGSARRPTRGQTLALRRMPFCCCPSSRARRSGRLCRTVRCCEICICRKGRKARRLHQLRGRCERRRHCWWSASWRRQASTFERLQAAGKLARAALETEPRIGAAVGHGTAAPRPAARPLGATLAALQAAAFRLPSFKSRPAARTRLARIDVAASSALPDLRPGYGDGRRQQSRALADGAAAESPGCARLPAAAAGSGAAG